MKWLIGARIIICIAALSSVGVLVLIGLDTQRAQTPPPVPSLTAAAPQITGGNTEQSASGRSTSAPEPAPSTRAEPTPVVPSETVSRDMPTGTLRPVPFAREQGGERPPQNPMPPLRQPRDTAIPGPAVGKDGQLNVAALPRPVPSVPSAGRPHAVSVLGEWLLEDGAARMVIRPCGVDLCGLVNWPMEGGELGTHVLRDMKPVASNRWEGRIFDSATGRSYASSINLKAGDILQVEGCGSDFLCGGQNWARAKGQALQPSRR